MGIEDKILKLYQDRAGKSFGAVEVDKALMDKKQIEHVNCPFVLSRLKNSTVTDRILKKLVEKGSLEKCEQGQGFKYKKAS